VRLAGDIALVSGASSGIGRAIAILFAAEGARLACVDLQEPSRLPEETPSTVEVIRQSDGEAVYLQADVRNAAQIDQAVDDTLERFGRIDILVNNAGIFVRNPVDKVSEEEWDKVLAVNLKAYFLFCRRVIPEMQRQGGGRIVNIGSIHGIRGTGTAATYCASKGGVENLTKQLAVECASSGIRVNSVAPGVICTAMSLPFRETPEICAEYEARTLLPRLGQPTDVAYAALYLASSESDFVTGHSLVVDGGWTIW
jgi:NAD(P)-dependent dehydrogenase (short-subunit alcohol dehydrogenase family)